MTGLFPPVRTKLERLALRGPPRHVNEPARVQNRIFFDSVPV